MSDRPSTTDIKNIKKDINTLKKRIAVILDKYNFDSHLTQSVKTMRWEPIIAEVFDKQTELKSVEETNQGFAQLIKCLYSFRYGQRYWNELNDKYDSLLRETNSSQKDLSILKSSLLWTISSRRKKDAAIESFGRLERVIKEFEQSAEQIIPLLSSALESTDKESIIDFIEHRNEYCLMLRKRNPDLFNFAIKLPNVQKAENIRDLVFRQRGSIESESIELQNRIKDLAISFNNEEMQKELDKKPISELSRFGNGLRISALEWSGYRSVGSIIGMSHSQLTNIYGLGQITAENIYQAAKHYAAHFKDSFKVRLNADNKTDKATALLRAVEQYLGFKNNNSDLYELVNICNIELNLRINTLNECLKNGIEWLFYTEELQKQYKDKYTDLKTYTEQISVSYADYQTKTRKLHDLSDNEVWQNFQNNPILYYTVLEELETGLVSTEYSSDQLQDELKKRLSSVELHLEGLKCTLRNYQEWGVRFALAQKKVLLGDEMGLGKTIQAIAVINSLKNDGAKRFLVICPLSVLVNWCREIETNSNLKAVPIYGKDKYSKATLWKNKGGVGVTTYETLNSVTLWNTEIDQVVIDEAHYIKNPDANRTYNAKIVCKSTERILLMTGTALENKVEEMISLISILDKTLALKLQNMPHVFDAPQFRVAIQNVYFRRKREDVLSELPELIENEEWCLLSAEEESRYYYTLYAGNYSDVRKVSWNVGSLKKSSKASRMMEILRDAKEDGRKVLIFSFFRQTLDDIKAYIGNSCYGPINGSISSDKRQEIIDSFNKAPSGSSLVSQIIAGGTGLNIQSASVVIICEPQWKPSTENQAISRAYRMGQARNVHVHRLLCKDTVDEKITDLLYKKQMIFDTYADKSVAADKIAIDNRTFGNIIKEELARLGDKYSNDNLRFTVPSVDSIARESEETEEIDETNFEQSGFIENLKTVLYHEESNSRTEPGYISMENRNLITRENSNSFSVAKAYSDLAEKTKDSKTSKEYQRLNEAEKEKHKLFNEQMKAIDEAIEQSIKR